MSVTSPLEMPGMRDRPAPDGPERLLGRVRRRFARQRLALREALGLDPGRTRAVLRRTADELACLHYRLQSRQPGA